MGFQCLIGGDAYELEDFSVSEASTPLSAGDSSGQVGTVTLSIKRPDPFGQVPSSLQDSSYVGNPVFATLGAQMLIGKDFRLTDSRKGFTLGKIVEASDNSQGTISITCESRLGLLNVYGVQAPPVIGTLSQAFETYLDLAGVTTDLFVDPSIAGRQVVFPGWSGELWFYLKQMAAAIDADVSLVSGVILLRPIRERIAARGREVSSSFSIGGPTAQFVEVFKYNNRPISNRLVYPPGGWTEQVAVINVNAGEYLEEVIELSASVSSIQQPTMQTFVSRAHSSSSVFTVVGDDGLPVSPAAWTDSGGSLSVEINPDTTSLTVKIQAPTSDLPNKDGTPIGVYSISLSSDSSTGRYSTLRIIGSGVAFKKESVRFATGLTESQTGTEVGETIDNPFLSTTNQLYRAGTRAARRYKGKTLTGSFEVISVNQLGDSGSAAYPEYGFVQGLHSGKTYATVKAGYAGKGYGRVKADLFELVSNDFDNQVFGNVSGARAYNPRLRRWMRIREGTLSPSTISARADDDLTHGDVKSLYGDLSYASERALFQGLTYSERNLAGLYRPEELSTVDYLYPATDLYPAPDLYPGVQNVF